MDLPLFEAFHRIPLISTSTPVQSFDGVNEWLGHRQLFVKREDATDSVYGGNKVRNLEFILGEAVAKGARRVITTAPLGSNFVAAMAAQTRRIGMPSRVFHFVPALTPQIEAHASFSHRQGAELRRFSGGRYLGALKAGGALVSDMLREPGSYWISPGGSSALGALGHVRAVFELAEQIKRGEIPEPDVLIVGVGTCGTMAGLLSGIRLTGLKTHVVGMRCVDPIICNRYRVASLANSAMALLKARGRFSPKDVDLRDLDKLAYGESISDAEELILQVKTLSGILLDTTYTTKVFSFLKKSVALGEFTDRKVLYWNTFSPGAMSSQLAARPRTFSELRYETSRRSELVESCTSC